MSEHAKPEPSIAAWETAYRMGSATREDFRRARIAALEILVASNLTTVDDPLFWEMVAAANKFCDAWGKVAP